LNSLPEGIGKLKSLRLLNVGRNNLCSLPCSIGSLSSLEVLYLYENDLRSLPRSMKDLSKLRVLGLDGNPSLSCLPEHIKEPNAKAVAAYYAEME
jgi:Leucine-rich repeat (LRR) protein